MKRWDLKPLSLTGTILTLAGSLALSACDNKESTPSAAAPGTSATAAASATDDPSAAASGTGGADEMHNRMETDHRQRMDHDEMRRGTGMNHPDSTRPSPQPTGTDSPMPGGGMQDM